MPIIYDLVMDAPLVAEILLESVDVEEWLARNPTRFSRTLPPGKQLAPQHSGMNRINPGRVDFADR
jgi:hypothetical protein